jgi:tRNA A-37 threonylcarbamoyl transferase component Bud32/tetratricopeptide (TPR) repeat protein
MDPAMNMGYADGPQESEKHADLEAREIRICKACGARLSVIEENELCPACMLRRALSGGVEAAEPSLAANVEAAAAGTAPRFEHYELVLQKDGRPLELGRGAMGVTYKAIDVDLHCLVTLKVISEKYLGEEAARQRFLREARAAASVRHPNVASVFHLGRKGRDYFYAMEFVEGKTLDNLIKRSGALETKLALEVVSQVAAGLAAVHKRRLVHRDIKPSNIMVSFEEEGAVTAKIIDLGLAKVDDESSAQTTISATGAFAGTPEFASPEQIIGGDVDIRSDLYSLGVALWQMLTGNVPFRGNAASVMSQHQHASLPLEQLQNVPQPVASLIGVLLEKDPGRRYQTPAELLKALAMVMDAIEEGGTLNYTSLGQMAGERAYSVTRNALATLEPEKISIARLPVTGGDLFGRKEDLAFLNDAWANPATNIVTIVAWAGVGKSTLINHWLRGMAAEHYRSAELVFGWSFYRQGTSGATSSADEFLDAALNWFGDPGPRLGTPWEKGERLAKLISQRRTLLVLDGLEPLQHPPGPQEGRLREASLQALLKELAAFNRGLCVVTTRLPVADIADHERSSAPRCELEHLSSDAGENLLESLGVRGDRAELRRASHEFNGHCLALTLLGSYLTDAHGGDIRYRKEVSGHLSDDVRQGAHARKVMESYQSWFGEGPEVSVLCMLGLFDRRADAKVFDALLKPPAITGLTESLIDLSPGQWQSILGRLRRARLLAGEDPHTRGYLDTHPLVREYFGEQLRNQRAEAWKECNRRLFHYYRAVAPRLPESFREMEPLLLAVICGCNAGLFREALHEVYIPRIQRGNACFAANVLGARGALLAVLGHFFDRGNWGCFIQHSVEEQYLAAEDQLFVLMQAGLYLTATRGHATREVRICYEDAEPLCHSLNRPLDLFASLIGQWRHSLLTDKLMTTMQLAKRAYSVAREEDEVSLLTNACRILAVTHYFSGNFKVAQRYAKRGVQLGGEGRIRPRFEEVNSPAVVCLSFEALCGWHFGEIAASRDTMARAVSLAKELNDTYASAVALFHAQFAAHFEADAAEVERLASELVELSTRQHFDQWRAAGKVFGGWARSACGNPAKGITGIEEGIEEWKAPGSTRVVPYWLALKGEALHFAGRLNEALETVQEAEALAKASGELWWLADLYRLQGVFLSELEETQDEVEQAFCKALSTAKQQKSISLAKRAETTYAEYCHQNAPAPGGFRGQMPLS